ncbi:hypothetical protein GYMLUDRAFT_674670 [Collybiopsis luxurians FD-317 M1]|uniref:Uncharacterized protein n=1 Tax=Collybiopsis luxurians FD-317 M1 TaxID=944289 RepID=A0A0D0CTU2_9AGAR|nr:hypothetical protein GYMLUDRAFT_674670 [Collybiopsis luxurians FD-317 M1]
MSFAFLTFLIWKPFACTYCTLLKPFPQLNQLSSTYTSLSPTCKQVKEFILRHLTTTPSTIRHQVLLLVAALSQPIQFIPTISPFLIITITILIGTSTIYLLTPNTQRSILLKEYTISSINTNKL